MYVYCLIISFVLSKQQTLSMNFDPSFKAFIDVMYHHKQSSLQGLNTLPKQAIRLGSLRQSHISKRLICLCLTIQ